MVEATDLLTKIADGNRIALSQLYDRYSRLIYAIAWKSLNSVEDCEEVVLEVFIQVWRIADRFDSQKGSPDQWIFTLARSRVIDRLRKIQLLNKVNLAITTEKEIAFSTLRVNPLETIEIAERQQQVSIALGKIPLEQRQAIEMAYYQGLTHTEIATVTGLSIGTVKTRIRLGLGKLRVSCRTEHQVLENISKPPTLVN
jgi:RNA polymerase sigma-70 factor, ECF subfamily